MMVRSIFLMPHHNDLIVHTCIFFFTYLPTNYLCVCRSFIHMHCVPGATFARSPSLICSIFIHHIQSVLHYIYISRTILICLSPHHIVITILAPRSPYSCSFPPLIHFFTNFFFPSCHCNIIIRTILALHSPYTYLYNPSATLYFSCFRAHCINLFVPSCTISVRPSVSDELLCMGKRSSIGF